MSPKVLNAREVGMGNDPTQVYVGRPTKWGNPFKIGPDGGREVVIAMYREWIAGRSDLLAQLPELAGKNLVCWCAPKACHADVLLELCSASNADGKPGSQPGE